MPYLSVNATVLTDPSLMNNFTRSTLIAGKATAADDATTGGPSRTCCPTERWFPLSLRIPSHASNEMCSLWPQQPSP